MEIIFIFFIFVAIVTDHGDISGRPGAFKTAAGVRRGFSHLATAANRSESRPHCRADDERALTVRAAQELTGIAAADFSRIHNAALARFTIDRLMSILAKLGQQVEVTVTIRPQHARQPAVAAHP
jgi:Helix-turn-helix domain